MTVETIRLEIDLLQYEWNGMYIRVEASWRNNMDSRRV